MYIMSCHSLVIFCGPQSLACLFADKGNLIIIQTTGRDLGMGPRREGIFEGDLDLILFYI